MYPSNLRVEVVEVKSSEVISVVEGEVVSIVVVENMVDVGKVVRMVVGGSKTITFLDRGRRKG